MKPTLLLSALLSCFVISGNAQESAVPGSIYSTQGNAAQNKSIYENELQSAAVEARKMKELKASIASQGFAPPPVITTADQFLSANRPPMPPPTEQPEEDSERPDAYVPDFDSGPSAPAPPVQSTANVPSFEMPQKERSFFKWMKSRKKEEAPVSLPPAGPSEYQTNPYQTPAPAPPEPALSQGIPDVPAMNEEPAPITQATSPEPSSAPAPIFVRRPGAATSGGETATVQKDTDAFVSGVMVKLFAGSQVTVLSKSGGDATVRIPDGRVGIVKRKDLSR